MGNDGYRPHSREERRMVVKSVLNRDIKSVPACAGLLTLFGSFHL